MNAGFGHIKPRRFWKIIAAFDWTQGSEGAIMAPAVARLATLSEGEIRGFEDMLCARLYELDGQAWAEGNGMLVEDGAFFSVDCFLYARCLVVANGKRHFRRVLKDPSLMPGGDDDFESLLYLAQRAYEEKTGQEGFLDSRLSAETYSNVSQWV